MTQSKRNSTSSSWVNKFCRLIVWTLRILTSRVCRIKSWLILFRRWFRDIGLSLIFFLILRTIIPNSKKEKLQIKELAESSPRKMRLSTQEFCSKRGKKFKSACTQKTKDFQLKTSSSFWEFKRRFTTFKNGESWRGSDSSSTTIWKWYTFWGPKWSRRCPLETWTCYSTFTRTTGRS